MFKKVLGASKSLCWQRFSDRWSGKNIIERLQITFDWIFFANASSPLNLWSLAYKVHYWWDVHSNWYGGTGFLLRFSWASFSRRRRTSAIICFSFSSNDVRCRRNETAQNLPHVTHTLSNTSTEAIFFHYNLPLRNSSAMYRIGYNSVVKHAHHHRSDLVFKPYLFYLFSFAYPPLHCSPANLTDLSSLTWF